MATKFWDEPHTYVVEGRGEFPFDQLRKEEAWPTTTADAMNLGRTEPRRVAITVRRLRNVERRRWESFGWEIVAGIDEWGMPTEISYARDVQGEMA